MKKFFVTASVLMPLMSTTAIQAQSVNYDDLKDLFGEPVTTSATGKPQRQSEAPASMIIITGEQLRRSGVRSIPDILQNYAGMDVNRYATNQREVTIRGGNLPLNPRLLVLVNGRQAYLDHYGYTDWALIGVEINEIQQIEVVKGPNSALFGFNAVAGVINIITIDSIHTGNSFSVRAEGGTENTYDLSMVGTFKIGENTGLKVSGGLEGTEEWSSIASNDDKPKAENFSGQLTSQIADNVRLTASYTYAKSNQLSQAYGYALHKNQSTFEGFNGLIAADTGLGAIKAQVFYNKLDQEVPTIGDFGIKNDILSVKVEDLFKVGAKHSVRLSAEYRRNEYEIKRNTAGKTFYDVFSGGAMWEWQAAEKLTFTNAVRVDRLNLGHGPINQPLYPRTVEDYDRSYTELSYNSSIVYQMDDLTRLRVGAARGVQAPSLNALGVSVIIPGVVVAGNPTLTPGITKSYELALDRNVTSINGNFNLTLSTSTVDDFLAAAQNAIADPLSFGGPVLIITDEILGDFKTYAIEAALNGRSDDDMLGWSLNYTWTDVKEDFLTPVLETNVTMAEGTPAHKINVLFDYVNGPWNAYVAGRYRSGTEQSLAGAGISQSLSGAITVDAKVGYTWDNGLSFWVMGENLTSNDAAGLSIYRAESRFFAGVGFNF